MRVSPFLVLGSMLLVTSGFSAERKDDGPKIYPVAMSMDYNPLLWQGDDAHFALDMLHSSHCVAEVSKVVADETQNSSVQTLAQTLAHEQGKLNRQLRNMARTLHFPLPRKQDLEECPAGSRIRELSGQEMDSGYLSLLLKSSTANVSRFEEEVARPRTPSNWTLWKFAKNGLLMVRSEKSAVTELSQAIPNLE
ncbi:MAG TPA: DUF4142 domain-containing protein [Terriglobales bacterium]